MSARWAVIAAALWAGVGQIAARAADGGTPPPKPAPPAPAREQAPSPEDREVVENLDLLESLEENSDLDLLLELGETQD